MSRLHFAKMLMTLVLLGGSASSFVLDWSGNHLLNPLWHPHARFHGALLLFFLAGVSLMGTWLLWRRSAEPEVGLRVSLMISIAFWTPLFYIPYLLPSSTWWAGVPGAEPRIDGVAIYPNLVVAAAVLVVSLVAYAMGKGVALAASQP